MDYGNKLRKREPHLLYTGNSQGGTDFARAYSVDLGTGTYQWTKKTEELNQFLNTQLGVGYAEKVSLEARITATVAGMEERSSVPQSRWM